MIGILACGVLIGLIGGIPIGSAIARSMQK